MGRIRELDAVTANGIAAGEVVERPSSVVKELVENAMDAGATVITVEISGGGISLIRVSDDGCGMDEDDAKLAFICHATSKLNTLEDLFALHTMGFRGEALSSISAAARVDLKTRQPGSETGTQVVLEAGKVIKVAPTGGPSGTRIEVKDLFFNLPARYKFLKKDQTEAQYITLLCQRFALIRPDISFRLINQGKEILHTPGNNEAISSLYCIYGRQIVDQCIPLDGEFGDLNITGFIGKPEIARSSRGEQIVFVNDRLIRSKAITSAIDEAYKTMLMKGRYAFIILSIKVPAHLVDVNVHPQKSEVRFWNDGEVFRSVYHMVNNALLSATHVVEPKAIFGETAALPEQEEDSKAIIEVEQIPTELPVASAESSPVAPTRPLPQQQFLDISALPQPGYAEEKPLLKVGEKVADYEAQSLPNKSVDTQPEPPIILVQSPYEFTIHDLLRARIIGVAFATYILLECDHYLVLLDQHAAHEKILFEKLLTEHKNNRTLAVHSQPLLIPEIINMTPADMILLEELTSALEKTGFSFELLGEQEIVLRAVPDVSCAYQPGIAFRFAFESLQKETPKTDEDILLLLATTACKSAVKGHDRLDPLEIQALLKSLTLLNNPYHCPHGRPIIIRLSQKELEKEFKRIV